MKTIIYLGGIYNFLFAIFHIGFWKMFNWVEELKKIDAVNSAVMQVMNVQLIYYFLFTAVICIAFPTELKTTKLGKAFLLSCAGFWLLRTIQQFIFFEINIGTYVLTAILLVGVVLFTLPVFKK